MKNSRLVSRFCFARILIWISQVMNFIHNKLRCLMLFRIYAISDNLRYSYGILSTYPKYDVAQSCPSEKVNFQRM